MKTITVVVAKDGSTRVETHGFHGAECQKASEFLTKALGAVADERLTSEFFQATQPTTLSTETRS